MARFDVSLLGETLSGAAAGAVALGLAIGSAQAKAQDPMKGAAVAPSSAQAAESGGRVSEPSASARGR